MMVTGAVQVYLQLPPTGRGVPGKPGLVHTVVGPVNVPIVVLEPPRVSEEGVMLVMGAAVLLVTVMTKVAVSPGKWQVVAAYGPVIAIPTLKGLTLSTFELPAREVAAPLPMRTSVTPYMTVPLSVEAVLQVYVIVPEAPAARLSGLGLVLVREQLGFPPEKVPLIAPFGG